MTDTGHQEMGRVLIHPTALPPETPVERLSGVGAAKARGLARLGVVTLSDLLLHLPRRYEDTREVTSLRALMPGSVQTARVMVRSVSVRHSPKRGIPLVEATLEGDGAQVGAVWFNQPYLRNQLPPGTELLVSGKVVHSLHGLTFQSPTFERAGPSQRHVGRLAAVDRNLRAVGGERFRNGAADAFGRPGHQRAQSGEIDLHEQNSQ